MKRSHPMRHIICPLFLDVMVMFRHMPGNLCQKCPSGVEEVGGAEGLSCRHTQQIFLGVLGPRDEVHASRDSVGNADHVFEGEHGLSRRGSMLGLEGCILYRSGPMSCWSGCPMRGSPVPQVLNTTRERTSPLGKKLHSGRTRAGDEIPRAQRKNTKGTSKMAAPSLGKNSGPKKTSQIGKKKGTCKRSVHPKYLSALNKISPGRNDTANPQSSSEFGDLLGVGSEY